MSRWSAVLALVVACGGSKAPATVAPAPETTGLRVLAEDDAELPAIVIAAARSLESSSDLAVFSGVFVKGREVKALTDSVGRVTRLTVIRESRGVPFTICRMDTPGCDADRARATVSTSFTLVRATEEAAYVAGESKRMGREARFTCISLLKAGGRWMVTSERTVSTVQRCVP